MTDEARPDDRSATPPAPESPEPTDQPAPPEPAAEPAPEPAAPTTPWDTDLAAQFDDPAQRAAVSEFLRARVQPYVTKLEQESAPNRNAVRLWDDFRTEPAETFMSVAEEIFGSDRAEELRRILAEDGADPEPAVNDAFDDSVKLDELPPEAKEAIEWAREQKRNAAWANVIKQVEADNPGLKINEALFAPFVNAADGDVDQAVEGYKNHISSFADEYGFQKVETPEVDPAEGAPTTIGADTRAPTAPPVEKKYETVDEAIDDLWNDMQANKAPATV